MFDGHRGTRRAQFPSALALWLLLAFPHPIFAEWTVAAFLGGSRTAPTILSVAQPDLETAITVDPVRFRSESLKAPLYDGVRVSQWPGRSRFGIEAEFIHAKAFAETTGLVSLRGTYRGLPIDERTPMSSLIQHFGMSHGLNFFLVNAAVRQPLGATPGESFPAAVLVGRFGIGATRPHGETIVENRKQDGYRWGGVGMQWAVGAELRIRARVYFIAEYKFTRTRQAVSIPDGDARLLLHTHHVAMGALLRL